MWDLETIKRMNKKVKYKLTITPNVLRLLKALNDIASGKLLKGEMKRLAQETPDAVAKP